MKTPRFSGSDPLILCTDHEPPGARAFDFEGTNAELAAECAKDRSATGCEAHAAYWNGPQHHSLWRIEDRARFIRESPELMTPLWLD